MAKKIATVAYPSVETVLASIEAADAKSHAGIVQAKATMVADLIAAIRGKVAPLTAETWKSTWADPVKTMLTAAKNADGSNRYNSAGTISVTLSWMRNVFLAHIPAVDTMIALMKHEHFGSATRDDANVLLAALRKNPTALLTMAKALAS